MLSYISLVNCLVCSLESYPKTQNEKNGFVWHLKPRESRYNNGKLMCALGFCQIRYGWNFEFSKYFALIVDGDPILEPVVLNNYDPQGKTWTSTRSIVERHPGSLYRGEQCDAFRSFDCNVNKTWLQHPKILWLRRIPGERTEEAVKREIEKQCDIAMRRSYSVSDAYPF
jgi:hypothetical protein